MAITRALTDRELIKARRLFDTVCGARSVDETVLDLTDAERTNLRTVFVTGRESIRAEVVAEESIGR